jgi:hypothetical protein
MTTCIPARKTPRPSGSDRPERPADLPPRPDKRLWEADKAGAFEAGVRWFLAVSRGA